MASLKIAWILVRKCGLPNYYGELLKSKLDIEHPGWGYNASGVTSASGELIMSNAAIPGYIGTGVQTVSAQVGIMDVTIDAGEDSQA